MPQPWRVVVEDSANDLYRISFDFIGAIKKSFERRLPPPIEELFTSELPKSGVRWRLDPQTLTENARFLNAGDLATLQRVGGKLYEAVFDDYTQTLLTMTQPGPGDSQVAIAIDLKRAPRLAELPWEALYCKEARTFLAIEINTQIIRLLEPEMKASPPAPIAGEIRLLVVVANVGGELQTDTEVREIERSLRSLGEERDFDVRLVENANRQSLRDAIQDFTPHIIHFIGHGGFIGESGQIYLHDRDDPDECDPVDAATLVEFTRADRPWLIVLNSCQGAQTGSASALQGVAQNLVLTPIPFVVAMQAAISDIAAVAFARNFYRHLALGRPIGEAVTRGRSAIRTEKYLDVQIEFVTPVLYSSGQATEIARVVPPTLAPASKTQAGPLPDGETTDTLAKTAGRVPRWVRIAFGASLLTVAVSIFGFAMLSTYMPMAEMKGDRLGGRGPQVVAFSGDQTIDCARLRSAAELVVCDSRTLRDLDHLLALQWTKAGAGASQAELMEQLAEQIAFAARRAACGEDAACIADTYRDVLPGRSHPIDDPRTGHVRIEPSPVRSRPHQPAKSTDALVAAVVPADAYRPTGTAQCPVGPFVIFFPWNSSEITAESKAILDRATEQLRACRGYSLRIVGNADRSGSAGYNVQLSQRRANAAGQYLVAQGAPVNGLEAPGETQPRVASSDGVRELQNRRVEVYLYPDEETVRTDALKDAAAAVSTYLSAPTDLPQQ